MNAEQPTAVRPSLGRGLILVIIALILVAASAFLVKNLDALIDSVTFYVPVRALAVALPIVLLIGLTLWVQGHRLLALSKGRSSLLGLVLGFVPGPGLLLLLVLPAKAETANEPPAEPEVEPEVAVEPESD